MITSNIEVLLGSDVSESDDFWVVYIAITPSFPPVLHIQSIIKIFSWLPVSLGTSDKILRKVLRDSTPGKLHKHNKASVCVRRLFSTSLIRACVSSQHCFYHSGQGPQTGVQFTAGHWFLKHFSTRVSPHPAAASLKSTISLASVGGQFWAAGWYGCRCWKLS